MRFTHWCVPILAITVFVSVVSIIGVGEAKSQGGAAISVDTQAGYLKSNQSKVFYHDGKWWAIARLEAENRWFIWRYDGSVWTRPTLLNKSATLKYDVFLNSSTGKLYVMGSHASASEFWRFTYSSGTGSWTKDTGFAVNPVFLNVDANNPVSLTQAANGDLWIFRIESNTLQAKFSTDGGATWSAVINIKTGLNTASGITDAISFTSASDNYIGVAYGETNAAGSKFGFLTHRDGDPAGTWSDESASLAFFGAERGSNSLSMTVDGSDNVFLLTQNGNASGSHPRNTLYKRSSGGTWQKFKVNTSADWKSPALAYDGTNNRLYVMGINTASQTGEYKHCAVGQESTLEPAAASILFSNSGESFSDLSAPPGGSSVSISTGLMVCADNSTADEIWYNQVALTSSTPVTIGAVTLSSNEVNANSSYTIPLTLSSDAELTAGAGIIYLAFPDNTLVPGSIAAGNILVDGTPCTTITPNPLTRLLTITTPVNLSNSQSFSVQINSGAGLLNPSLAGNYQLSAWTSTQPTQATSPDYTLTPATTTVTPATVSLSNTAPDSCANYSIAFNLGANGRLISGTSSFTLTFEATTNVSNGALAGVLVNGVAASATGNSATKVVSITVPPAAALSNNGSVTLYLPSPAVCNPGVVDNYTLTVATSVETTPVTSNPYPIIEQVVIGPITVNPAYAGSNASYNIPLTLSSNGALTASSDTLGFRFPVNTIVPSGIAADQIIVNGTPVPPGGAVSNNVTREVLVTTPVNLANGQSFSVVFNFGAGIVNPPGIGDYTLQAWTSVQPAAATSPMYSLLPNLDANTISPTTKAGYKKSNQSKVFYHDNQWWAIAYEEPENRWYIWKFNGVAWTKLVGMDKGTAFNYDALLDASAQKLYIMGSHKSLSKFRRYSYVGGTWQRDTGFPVALSDFIHVNADNPISMTKAKNGDIWIFRINTNTLQTKRSTDGGSTWSAIINVKTGLNTADGSTSAATFTAGGNNYVGVAYSEASSVSPKSIFGFLRHQDGAPNNSWTDESSGLKYYGSERSFNNICARTDNNGNVYLLTRNIGALAVQPRNTLYRRSAGVWRKFKVNSTASRIWQSPALAIDATNGKLYVMGINAATLEGEYKTCSLGQEATLDTATAKLLLNSAGGAFANVSSPRNYVTSASGLMVCADNTTADDIYYRLLDLGGGTPLIVGAVSVASNQINANATYTIPLQLSAFGALTTGSGVLNFVFPPNTFVPDNMPPSAVKVDGVPVSPGGVISNSTTRQVTVTTPIDLPNNHSFTVVFDSTAGAGILNPTTTGANYQVTCWTSAQPTQVKSPFYGLVQTTTTVTPALVTPFPTDPDSLADYTLAFNLGPHGRPLEGISTIMVKFDAATQVSSGPITGAKLNSKDAVAVADAVLRRVTVTIPLSLSLSNNSALTLFIPKAKVRNPNIAGLHTLMVATSVETTFVTSEPFELKASNSIGAPIAGTKKSFDRNNQSKMFYHGGFWWVTAHSKADSKWYLWKFDGLFWTQSTLVHTAAKNRPDCYLDASNNKVYILLPGTSTTYITRMTFASGTWSTDGGYPAPIPSFPQVSDRGINLSRANNGDFWVFRATDSTLTAKRSDDLGLTWSPQIIVKKHLNNLDALTDASAFTASGDDYMGVGYAENSSPGSSYGFLRHRDTDPETVWVDETAAIPQFSGTTSDDHLSMISYLDEVLMIIKTNGGGASTVNIGLLRRETNGVWTQFPVLKSTGWTRPVLAIDQTSDRLYVMGTREGGIKVGEMKSCDIGDYASLFTAPIDTIFQNETDSFFNSSVPLHPVTSATNLLIGNGNETRDELWYNLIVLGGTPKAATAEAMTSPTVVEEDFDGVQVHPNPFNPQTSFRFKVKEKAAVKLQIFNLTGQLVRTIIDEDLAPGVHQRRWNGRNQHGRPAASGVYFYRLQIGPKIFNGRIQMLK